MEPMWNLTIGTVTYRVEKRVKPDAEGRTVYYLFGPKGAFYATMRNIHDPEMMSLIHAGRGFGLVKAFKNLVLTDKGGELKVHTALDYSVAKAYELT